MKKRLIKICVILICLLVNFGFVTAKEGYHMDEIMSFQLANAEYNPWIVPCQPVGRLAKFMHEEVDAESTSQSISNFVNELKDVVNYGSESKLLGYTADVYDEPQWITGDEFKAYVTVDSSDDFNYPSVYFNVKDDNHPFLHFALIHTVSSIFKNEMTPVMGCLINILFLGGTLWMLMGIVELLVPDSKHLTLYEVIVALAYGLSSGAVATTLLIRMYGMVTFFVMWLLYLHLKKYKEGVKEGKWGLLVFVTICGFLTQYFFLFFCLPLALTFTVILFFEKRNEEAVRYMENMIFAAILGVCIFPFSISDVFSSGRGVEALENLKSGISGYGERIWAFLVIVAERTVGNVFILIGLLVISIASLVIMIRSLRTEAGSEVDLNSNCDSDSNSNPNSNKEIMNQRIKLIALIVLPLVMYFLLAARMSPYEVDRYIMPIFPLVSLCISLSVIYLVVKFVKNQIAMWITLVIIALIPIMTIIFYDGEYLYKGYSDEYQVSLENSEKTCVLVYEGYSFYENVPELINYEKTLLTKLDELEKRKETDAFNSSDDLIIYIKRGVEAGDVLQYFSGFGFENEELIFDESPYGDEIYLVTK